MTLEGRKNSLIQRQCSSSVTASSPQPSPPQEEREMAPKEGPKNSLIQRQCSSSLTASSPLLSPPIPIGSGQASEREKTAPPRLENCLIQWQRGVVERWLGEKRKGCRGGLGRSDLKLRREGRCCGSELLRGAGGGGF